MSYTHSSAEALAIQPDGRLLTAGFSSTDPGSDFAVVRFRRNGRVDRSFGNQGLVLTDFGGTDMAQDVKVQDDGRIVSVGSTDADGESVFALARYLPDGRLDPTFGDGGKVTTAVGSCCAGAVGVVILPDGRLAAAGNAGDGDTGLWVLAGYQADGSLDPAFGVGGLAISNHGDFGTELTDAEGRAGGEIVVSGWDGDEGPWAYFLVWWYDAEGTLLDTTYGGFGGEAANYAQGIATHPNGHAAAVGYRRISMDPSSTSRSPTIQDRDECSASDLGRRGDDDCGVEVATDELVAQSLGRSDPFLELRARLPRLERSVVVPLRDRGEPQGVVLRAEQPGPAEAGGGRTGLTEPVVPSLDELVRLALFHLPSTRCPLPLAHRLSPLPPGAAPVGPPARHRSL